MAAPISRSPINSVACNMLEPVENKLVFKIIGEKCVSLCSTVAQVFETEPPSMSWNKKGTGVLCFIKDNVKRSYYCRLVCLINHRVIWEQEMYDSIQFDMSQERKYLITFEGENGIVALNFALEGEAVTFLNIATTTISNRNKRREERKSQQRLSLRLSTGAASTTDNPVTFIKKPGKLSSNSKKKDKKGKIKLTIYDISSPSGFKHVSHIGTNLNDRFDLTNDPQLRPFLEKAGISENQLNDRHTRKFITSFVQSHNVKQVISGENQTKIVKPPRRAPLTPRPARPAPKCPPSRPLPSLPTPPSGAGAPPPPPPPMLPPPPAAVSLVTSTPKVAKPAFAPDPRDALLDSIKNFGKGSTLKKVDPQEKQKMSSAASVKEQGSDVLANALRDAMMNRAIKVRNDSPSGSEDDQLDEDSDQWEEDS